MQTKRWFVWASLGLAIVLGLVATVSVMRAAEAGGVDLGVQWELYAEDLLEPVGIVFTGIETDTRMFVVERDGRIKVVLDTGTVLTTPFLNIDSIVDAESYGEMGLLGLAFDPDYQNNGYFYVYYNTNSGDIQLARYQVSADPNIALTTSVPILFIPHPTNDNHNGGDLMFGPDGYLYMAPGDGAFSQNAQNTNTLLGKVLRIDVTDEITYSVPASNPFTQTVNYRPEIWAYGLRNPWRFSFDMETGEFYIADVGQEQWEEVNRQPAGSSGQNYGWRCYEGNHTFNTSGCPISTTLTFPITEYSHALGSAIAGGYVYRGAEYPSLDGYYFFADNGSRRFWAINTANNEVTALGQMLSPGANPSTFGQDPEGEMYVADLSSGNIYKLKGPLPPPPVQTPSFLPLLRLDE